MGEKEPQQGREHMDDKSNSLTRELQKNKTQVKRDSVCV